MNKIKILIIDFETRTDNDRDFLRNVGQWRYSKESEIILGCYAYCIIDKKGIRLEPVQVYNKDKFRGFDKDVDIVLSHNFNFEYSIIQAHKIKLPKHVRFFCTRFLCAYFNYPLSLANIGPYLKINQLKMDEGKELLEKYSFRSQKNGMKLPKTIPLKDFKLLLKYCKQDVVTCFTVFKKLLELLNIRDIKGFARLSRLIDVFNIDFNINRRGYKVDIPLAKKLNKTSEDILEYIKNKRTWNIHSHIQFKHALTTMGVKIDNTQKETLLKYLEDNNNIGDKVKELIQDKLEVGGSATKKLQAILRSHDKGICYFNLKSNETVTGRYAGSIVQPQNFPRGKTEFTDKQLIDKLNNGTLKENVHESIRQLLSAVIIPRKNKLLLYADYSGIELRVALWFCEEFYLLRKLHEGFDLYKDVAKLYFDKKDISKEERTKAKTMTLARMYGMGNMDEKFKKYFDNYFAGIKSAWDVCKTVLNVQERETKNYKWYTKGNDKCVRLISGHTIRYPNFKKTPNGKYGGYSHEYTNHSKNLHERLYGSKLFQHMIQSLSYSVLFNAISNIERLTKADIVLSVHDEIICEIDKETDAKEVINIMKTPPDWCTNLLLGVEYKVGRRYSKSAQ